MILQHAIQQMTADLPNYAQQYFVWSPNPNLSIVLQFFSDHEEIILVPLLAVLGSIVGVIGILRSTRQKEVVPPLEEIARRYTVRNGDVVVLEVTAYDVEISSVDGGPYLNFLDRAIEIDEDNCRHPTVALLRWEREMTVTSEVSITENNERY